MHRRDNMLEISHQNLIYCNAQSHVVNAMHRSKDFVLQISPPQHFSEFFDTQLYVNNELLGFGLGRSNLTQMLCFFNCIEMTPPLEGHKHASPCTGLCTSDSLAVL